MEQVRYMISDAANLVKVDSHVLRYWEEELDLDIPRNELGHRYYTEDNIQEFFRIKEWKAQGYQLKAIRMLVQEERRGEMAEKRKTENRVHQEQEEYGLSTRGQAQVSLSQTEQQPGTNVKLEQFQAMMTNIVRNALVDNNQALGKEVGNQVEDKVIKEMNYLMRVQEEAQEERFRRLDSAIRAQKAGRRLKGEKKQKEAKLSRKERKLNPNLSM